MDWKRWYFDIDIDNTDNIDQLPGSERLPRTTIADHSW